MASQQEASGFGSRSFQARSLSLYVLSMNQGTGSVPGPCKGLPNAPLRDGLNAENEFRYVYVTIKYLYLILKEVLLVVKKSQVVL